MSSETTIEDLKPLEQMSLKDENSDLSLVKPPIFDPQNDLHKPINVDINEIIESLWETRIQSPIVPRADTADLERIESSGCPQQGEPIEKVVDNTVSLLKNYSRHISHPGHFGYLAPQGLRTDPMGFAMTAAMNQNVAMYASSPLGATLESTVISWLCELAGYDTTKSSGCLLSGGSTSNLTSLATALAHYYGPEYRRKGLIQMHIESGEKNLPVLICSESAHFCFQRAAGMLGLGVDNVVTIPNDENFSMRLDLLEEAVEKYSDENGRGIVCIAATAGTTLTGGLDDLSTIHNMCEEKDIWFHVDAAYGGSALLSSELRPLLKGIQNADSITMDLHKWFYMSLDCSAILYKDPKTVKSLFEDTSNKVVKELSLDSFSKSHLFFLLGPELSRRMRALPLYIAFQHYGMEKMGKNVLFNVQCAKYLGDRVNEDPELEVVVQSKLSICIFRMLLPKEIQERLVITNAEEEKKDQDHIDVDAIVDELNCHIRDTLEAEDQFFLSGAKIHSRPLLRVCIVNYNSRPHHIDQLLVDVKRIGKEWLNKRFGLEM